MAARKSASETTETKQVAEMEAQKVPVEEEKESVERQEDGEKKERGSRKNRKGTCTLGQRFQGLESRTVYIRIFHRKW